MAHEKNDNARKNKEEVVMVTFNKEDLISTQILSHKYSENSRDHIPICS